MNNVKWATKIEVALFIVLALPLAFRSKLSAVGSLIRII